MSWMTVSNSKIGEELDDYITISPARKIHLSKGFILKNKLQLENKNEAVFLYESKSNSLGIYFTKYKANDSFKITYDHRNIGGAKVSCIRMFKAFNLDAKKYSGRYTYKIDSYDNKKLYIVDLDRKVQK